MKILLIIMCLVLTGCGEINKTLTPADNKVHNQTWTFDCCSPCISVATEELCNLAKQEKDNTMIDSDGNKYVYSWKRCEKNDTDSH